MGGPQTPSLTIDPATRALQKQAQDERIALIQDRVSDETRNNLIRFGRRKAFAGASLPGFGLGTGGIEGLGKRL